MFKGKSSGSFASKIAHTTTLPGLGNKDLKLLQDLITNEKAILTTLQKLAVDFTRASESLKAWGLGEGEDLGDVLLHATSIYAHISTALNNFANHEHTVRAHLKSIRSREEKLDELKRKRKSVSAKADAADKKLSKMSGENKNLPAQTSLLGNLRDEIRGLDTEIMVEEARLGDFKRLSTRNFMALKLGGLLEFGEKATIVGELGKLLIEEIPLEHTPPGQPRAFYQSHAKTENLAAEVSRCIGEVVFTAPPADMNENADVYQQPLSGGPGDAPNQGSQVEDAQPQPADGGFSTPNAGDLRVTMHVTKLSNTSPTQDEPPTNEFGESGAHRRFGSGPIRTGDDGPRIGIGGGGGQFSTFPVKARSNTGAGTGSGLGGDSFSASIADALRLDGSEGANPERSDNRDSEWVRVPPPSVTVGGNVWSGDEYGQAHSRTGSQDSSQLAYIQESQDQRTGSTDTLGVEKGVRFRTPSMEVSGMGPIAPGVASPMFPSAGGDGRDVMRLLRGLDDIRTPVSPTHAPVQEDEHEHDPPEYTNELEPPEDVQARNSAAAREVARELDTLHFAPPGPMSPSQQQPYQSPTSLQPTRPLSIGRSPSPLSPPLAPFAQPRSVSPNPGVGSIPMPPESPRFGSNATPSPMNSETYGTPPEYPTPTSSLQNVTSPGPAGPRTISAAAFKRGGRSGSDPDMAKKRPLPSSPYPVRTGSSLAYSNSQDNLGRSGQLPPGAQAPDPTQEPDSPVMSDYGVLGNVRVANSDGPPPSPGYGQSHFVTNLEH
ncbi:hypothetical protein JB92DRAFT_2830442 [Gautieria morchelliformis]|nr:hypothetical protein JB92DRAFT_2830442 [Gautieria morchelliformis]